jgi:hypothetical protein
MKRLAAVVFTVAVAVAMAVAVTAGYPWPR